MIPDLPSYQFALSLAGLASFVLTVVLPLLVAYVAKPSWSPSVKGVLLLALASVKAVAEAVIVQGPAFHPGQVLYSVALNFGIAVVAYLGIIKGSTVHTALLNSGNIDAPAPVPVPVVSVSTGTDPVTLK